MMNMLNFFLLISIRTSLSVAGVAALSEKNGTDVSQESLSVTSHKINPIMFLLQRKNLTSYCSSVDEFPNFFTDKQRKNGAIVIPFMVGIYCFTLLAVICDEYFIPCVEKICEFLQLSKDVAAATFMAMATSAPELFINIIGTFVTESDVGIGTVVGSSMFNTLGVAALGGLAAKAPIQVHWWPVTRDCFLYLLSIALLVVMTWDGLVYWYEGMILFIVYFMYFTVMFNNIRISNLCKRVIKKFIKNHNSSTDNTIKDKKVSGNDLMTINTPPSIFIVEQHIKEHSKDDCKKETNEMPLNLYSKVTELKKEEFDGSNKQETYNAYVELKQVTVDKVEDANREKPKNNASIKKRIFDRIVFIYMWPLRAVLFCLIPSPNIRPKLFPVTFILCIVIIGGNSYILSWMITVIGHTFRISDTVLGLTFLAGGACLPEAVSIVLMSRKGEGSMGVSNALGANTMNILLSLGLPWFIKSVITDNGSKGRASFIEISSGSIEYTILSLILVVLALYFTLYLSKFKLQRRTGIVLAIIYVVFLTGTLVTELLVFEQKPC